jgi:hypothetical protein
MIYKDTSAERNEEYSGAETTSRRKNNSGWWRRHLFYFCQNAVKYHAVRLSSLNSAPIIRVNTSEHPKILLLDTGSCLSSIQPGVCPSKIRRANVIPYGVTDELQIRGEQDVNFRVNDKTYSHPFCVCTLSTDADAIVGTDFLRLVNAKLDLEAQKLWMLKDEMFNHGSLDRRPSEARGTADRGALSFLHF